MRFERILFGAALFALLAGAADASTLYSQPWDGTTNSYASQNDTTSGGFGNFATTYDNFTLANAANINGVDFVGAYFNGSPETITAFTLTFYSDNAGIPGAAIATGVFPGNGGETANGTDYNYSLSFLDFFVNAGTYWLSVVPDLAFPPQWGWATGTGGDGNGYQCFFGTCGATGTDFAFTIDGSRVPEPLTLSLFGAGLAGVAAYRRRRKNVD